MKLEIKVPSVGESVTEATISKILKQSGSFVQKNEEILEIETDKVNQVIVAPEPGVLTLHVNVEDKVAIGQVIGFVNAEPAAAAAAPAPTPAPKVEPKPTPVVSQAGLGARESVDSYLKPPKPLAAPSAPSAAVIPASSPGKRVRMSGLRRTIAARLVEVKNTTAMLTTFNEVDMSEIMKIRSEEKEQFEKKYGVKLGFLSFFVRACSLALKSFPEVNAHIDGEDIVYQDGHHIGIAVSTEKGLFVPVLRDCQKLSFPNIESGVLEFAKKAREGKIGIQDLQGGTFTITNGGVFGSLLSTPILNPPQSAILGMHKIQPRPVAIDGEVVIRPMMYLALSYDHRIIDGKEAVGFLVFVKECLENPAKMLLES
jgi:2-oxoglutarate dehydrogenase E2 component (dihydrolipoamide succinyltransferase)